MIAAVRGALEHKTLDSALVSVGGVTLRVYCPLSTLSKLDVGETVHLHTYLLVREDALTLYGFSAESDRATFEQLIAITGVGARRWRSSSLARLQAPLAMARLTARADRYSKRSPASAIPLQTPQPPSAPCPKTPPAVSKT